MRYLFYIIFIFFPLFPGFSETFYVHSCELCDNEPIAIEFQAKEGILDRLFESGHIVFDDVMDSHQPEQAKGQAIKKLIADAQKSGANYLIDISLVSTTQKTGHNMRIECSVSYAIYDIHTKILLRDWKTKKTDTLTSSSTFWFTIGVSISDEITRFFSETAKKRK